MRQNVQNGQAGFSLLELLIAVGILSATAYVALDTVENNTGQRRYDLTEMRLEKIRRAIVGNPGLVVNGAPVISGFVADVGRLPDCLEELAVADSGCGGTTTDSPLAYGRVTTTGGTVLDLYFGWRGPYLTTGGDGLADGWGTASTTDENWGWTVTSPAAGQFTVASLGRDRASGALDPNSYDEDQGMPGIVGFDHAIILNSTLIEVDIENATGASGNYCVAVLEPNPTDATDWHLVSIAAPIAVAAGATVTVDFASETWSGSTVSAGSRPIIVYDGDDASVSGTCQPTLTNEDLVDDALLGSARFLFAPRTVPNGTLSFTLS